MNNYAGLKCVAMQRGTSDKGSRIDSAATRQISQLSADDSGRFDELIAELATAFIRASLPQIDEEINRSLKLIALSLRLDRSTVAEFRTDGFAFFSHGWVRDAHYAVIGKSLDVNALLPWTVARMFAGQTVIMRGVEELPDEASIDRDSFRRYGPKSTVMIPIKIGDTVRAAARFGALYHERTWPAKIVQQLQRMAQIFGYAF